MTTHSDALLSDPGIGLDEVHLLATAHEGTTVRTAVHDNQIRLLLEGGITMADAVFPAVKPRTVDNLPLFAGFVD